jgi:precorrin-6A synthase
VILLIGIGSGAPGHVTLQAVEAIQAFDVLFVVTKDGAEELTELRRAVVARHRTTPYRTVELPDPPRPWREAPDYRAAVQRWREQRAALWRKAFDDLHDETGAFLVWGDPSLYDSTLRILAAVAARVDIDYDVIPGITAIQALTSRHRIPLNDVGEPVLVTTGRQLRATGLSGSAVVMLDGDCSFRSCPPRTRIWWGAYLGTPDELLVSGTVGEVGARIADLRGEARARHGWIMDTYLLRSAD